jgi:hypothetical protein
LRTPPIPRVVPEGVFDAFGWCASDVLVLRCPEVFPTLGVVTAENPPGMAFVFRAPCDFLPRELARLHVPGVGLEDEWALAPYGIDDATDELHARDVRPGDVMWLAAADLPGLVWGLHDWAHFHNHGPFVARAWTELQCDASALSWLWINREAMGLDEPAWERTRDGFARLASARFHEEGEPFDAGWVEAGRLRALAEAARGPG